MNKSNGITSAVIAGVIVAVVFNIIAFTVPFIHLATFWICYIFLWVAVIVGIAGSAYAASKSKDLTSALYRSSFVTVAIVYMIVAAVASFIMMALIVPSWIAIIVHVVLLAICLFSMLGSHAGAEIVEAEDEATANQIQGMQYLRTQSSLLLNRPCDAETKRVLQQVNDSLRYSDPMASPATAYFDNQLVGLMSQMGYALDSGDAAQVRSMASQFQNLLAQRNEICRQSK